MSSPKLLTIGTSNHTWDAFYRLLELTGADTIIDIRSLPRSRHRHFNQRELKARLEHAGLPYVFLGHHLGGHNTGNYEEVAQSAPFLEGLARVRDIGLRCRPVLLCAEGEPLQCHRFLLVARALVKMRVEVAHILRDGSIEEQWQTELRLLRVTRLDTGDLFSTAERRLEAAYAKQEQRVTGAARRK